MDPRVEALHVERARLLKLPHGSRYAQHRLRQVERALQLATAICESPAQPNVVSLTEELDNLLAELHL
ncbi:hypothetical protein FVE85_3131 [Porphyridium purpureum]|uniref:Uncharacterized protein n=1 Tax=Porphyridium purpureum TaxID=35688 RepID=A0A5J4YVE2_PORPP|nr:hypothetical protein FVE85_3131 [Porphyridium purpureum]|eukprot:POR0972..scf227_4